MKQVEGNIIDLYNRKIFPGVISIDHGIIVSILENSKKYDHYIAPGFIDAHVHIESSMLTPVEFSKLVIKKGTIAVVNDPHEIANVLGVEGIFFMIENSKSAFIKIYFTIPSCVPSTSFDCSGSRVMLSDIQKLLESNHFIGLSEMMNVPGVLNQDAETIEKIEVVRKCGLSIDGHAPGLRGEDLRKYINMGISTDHECTDLNEALEKIQAGMKILIREGSAAKNYEALKSLISTHSDRIMFCTDDSHPNDLIEQGHIDKIVKRAIADGFDLFEVLKIASINPVLHYGLTVGTLRIGDKADFIIFDNLTDFHVQSVYLNGEQKYDIRNSGLLRNNRILYSEKLNHFERKPIHQSELMKSVYEHLVCIRAFDGQLITEKEVISIPFSKINFESDVNKDILKIVYLNRYGQSSPQIAFIRGFGLKRGAFASSISHDSHNIIAVGCNDLDITNAINVIIEEKGGLSIADDEDISLLPLPVAGIISEKSGEDVAEIWNELLVKLKNLGCNLNSPFMTLAFMALIVIPELKIGEKGLFEYSRFDFLSE